MKLCTLLAVLGTLALSACASRTVVYTSPQPQTKTRTQPVVHERRVTNTVYVEREEDNPTALPGAATPLRDQTPARYRAVSQ